MSDTERQQFFERYAPLAMEMQQEYGIPASVTLSQMALESGFGSSRLAREGNNYFGIKAGSKWVSEGKPFGYYSDDRPNEKFRHYSTVEQSIRDHTRVLMLDNYKQCRRYDSTDYHHWLVGIKSGGYATDPNYVASNEAMIAKYGLDKYDKIAKEEAQRKGVSIGYMQGKPVDIGVTTVAAKKSLSFEAGHWCMPITPDSRNQLVVTSDYGHRAAPTAGASTEHKGIDFGVNKVPVFATEDNGKVVSTGFDGHGGGNYVRIEYNRSDGTKYQVSCLHLDTINVKEGDTVQAGQQIGVSGNTGRSTGPHLDFRVKKGVGDNLDYINPSEYLAEISVRGGLTTQVVKGDKDLLADYKSTLSVDGADPTAQGVDPSLQSLAQATGSNNPADWLSYLMKKQEGQLSGSTDIIADLVGMVLASAMATAAQLDNSGSGETTSNGESQSTDQSTDATLDASTVKERTREGVNVAQAKQHSSMNYDSSMPEQSQSNGYRLA